MKRAILLREDFDTDERRKIYEVLCTWQPAEDAVEALVRNDGGYDHGEDRDDAIRGFKEDLSEFHEEWDDSISRDYDDDEGHVVLPVGFFLWVCRSFGWEPNEFLLRLGYFLMQVGEGIGKFERPRQLGDKRRDPESNLDYDRVGW